jgi:hypothetical protein
MDEWMNGWVYGWMDGWGGAGGGDGDGMEWNGMGWIDRFAKLNILFYTN